MSKDRFTQNPEVKERIPHLPRLFVEASVFPAIASWRASGCGEKIFCDTAAVDEMKKRLANWPYNVFNIAAEGKKDSSSYIPIGWIGEYINGRPVILIAEDSLECTNNCATGIGPSYSVLVGTTTPGGLYPLSDTVYQNRLVVGRSALMAGVNPQNTLEENLRLISMANNKNGDLSKLKVMLLDRKRNFPIINCLDGFGVQIDLKKDGDLVPAVKTQLLDPGSGYPMYDAQIGIGGGTETLLSALGVTIAGGMLWSSDWKKGEDDNTWMINTSDINTSNGLAPGEDLFFCATGVTMGDPVIPGIIQDGRYIIATSLLITRMDGFASAQRVRSYINESTGEIVAMKPGVNYSFA